MKLGPYWCLTLLYNKCINLTHHCFFFLHQNGGSIFTTGGCSKNCDIFYILNETKTMNYQCTSICFIMKNRAPILRNFFVRTFTLPGFLEVIQNYLSLSLVVRFSIWVNSWVEKRNS